MIVYVSPAVVPIIYPRVNDRDYKVVSGVGAFVHNHVHVVVPETVGADAFNTPGESLTSLHRTYTSHQYTEHQKPN